MQYEWGMQKDFQKWHTLKSYIEEFHPAPLFCEREIWWCSLGANVGVEEDGKNQFFERPILVYRKFNKEMLWAIPMTSREREGKFYFSFPLHGIKRTVILSQIRVLSAKRLVRRVGKMSAMQFRFLEDSFQTFIKKTDPVRGPRVPNGNL